MLKIRHSVHETNSSSSHSISIAENGEGLIDASLIPDENGFITLTGGCFGWEWTKFNDALTKANYCAVDCLNSLPQLEVIKQVIIARTCATDVFFNISTGYNEPNYSYIDHESVGTSPRNPIGLDTFIFNTMSYLYLGNDNGEPPPDFYLKIGQKVNYRVTCMEHPHLTNRLMSIDDKILTDVLQGWNIKVIEFPDKKIKIYDYTKPHTRDYSNPKSNIITYEMLIGELPITVGTHAFKLCDWDNMRNQNPKGYQLHYKIEEINEIV